MSQWIKPISLKSLVQKRMGMDRCYDNRPTSSRQLVDSRWSNQITKDSSDVRSPVTPGIPGDWKVDEVKALF